MAVDAEKNCLVVACPGSGKSRLIVTKAAKILRTELEAKVILVSFTRDSAAELRQRVSLELNAPIPKNCVISTFDSLTWQQLKRSYESRSDIPRLIMGDEAYSYFVRAFKRIPNGCFESMEKARERLDVIRGKIDYVPDEDDEEGMLFMAYQDLLDRHNVIDMAGIHRAVIEGLYMGTIQPFGATHMMVDEFQDVDQSQLEWILCHETAGAKITAVGDDDQSIYAFRNALGVEGMLSFERKGKAKKIFLSTNYRCYSEIVGYAESMILKAETRISKKLLSARGQGGSVTIEGYDSEEDESQGVVTSIMSMMTASGMASFKYGQYCVLARTNALLDSCDALLTAAEIPVRRASGQSFWEKKPACFLLNFLESLSGKSAIGIDQILSFAMDHGKDVETLHEKIGDVRLLMDGSIKLVLKPFSAKGKRILSSFCQFAPKAAALAKSETDENADDAIIKTFEWIEEHCSRSGEKAILSIARNSLLKMDGSIPDRIKKIRFLIRQKDSKDGEDNAAVFLGTMHGSKGLEFDNVWLIAINDGVIPDPRCPIDDELRLFYVAATRAKNRLLISYSKGTATVRDGEEDESGEKTKNTTMGASQFIEQGLGTRQQPHESIANALLEAV